MKDLVNSAGGALVSVMMPILICVLGALAIALPPYVWSQYFADSPQGAIILIGYGIELSLIAFCILTYRNFTRVREWRENKAKQHLTQDTVDVREM